MPNFTKLSSQDFGDDTDLAKYGNALSSAEYAEAEALAFNRSVEFSLNTPIAHDDDDEDEFGSGFVDDSMTGGCPRGRQTLLGSSRSSSHLKAVSSKRDFTNKTLDEIGTDLGVCGERVRQIEVRAVAKLAGVDEGIDCRPHSNDRALSQRLSRQTRELLAAVTQSIIRHWQHGKRGDALCKAVQAEFITFSPLQSRRMQRSADGRPANAPPNISLAVPISLINEYDYQHALAATRAIAGSKMQEEVARHIVEHARRRNEWPSAHVLLRAERTSPCNCTPRSRGNSRRPDNKYRARAAFARGRIQGRAEGQDKAPHKVLARSENIRSADESRGMSAEPVPDDAVFAEYLLAAMRCAHLRIAASSNRA